MYEPEDITTLVDSSEFVFAQYILPWVTGLDVKTPTDFGASIGVREVRRTVGVFQFSDISKSVADT
ncbi:hypothetical protein [Paenibacillus ferrarius]|uniref:hypothetical protein n=1 Tax=Paenibacillus ferrarius TaxID=1469647 RepID=UPI003D2CB646